MRTIVHLSDLHFGRIHAPTLEPLARAVQAIAPTVVAISGDLTQRATHGQFLEARAFLDSLPGPQIVVPGNHDVPLYNVLRRFAAPLAGYRRHISEDLAPTWADDEIAIVGVNTARSLAHKGGRVNQEQVAFACDAFGRIGSGRTRIVVTHHPFDLPEGYAAAELVGRSTMAMGEFARCGVDVFLAGHLHVSHLGGTSRYSIEGYSALVVQAGTATSNRQRREVNAFNILRIDRGMIEVETQAFQPETGVFARAQVRRFARMELGWAAA